VYQNWIRNWGRTVQRHAFALPTTLRNSAKTKAFKKWTCKLGTREILVQSPILWMRGKLSIRILVQSCFLWMGAKHSVNGDPRLHEGKREGNLDSLKVVPHGHDSFIQNCTKVVPRGHDSVIQIYTKVLRKSGRRRYVHVARLLYILIYFFNFLPYAKYILYINAWTKSVCSFTSLHILFCSSHSISNYPYPNTFGITISMDHFHGVYSSTMPKEEPIIRDMINDSRSEDQYPDVMDMEHDAPANTIHSYQSNTTTTTNMEYELDEHMCFSSKASMVFAFKQFYI